MIFPILTNVLTIRYWDDPVLSVVCPKIDDNEFGPPLEAFGHELIATMTANNGIGLAAPQVGVEKRIFVMGFKNDKNAEPIVACNPQIMLSGVENLEHEGCLSMPNIFAQVERSTAALLRYRDPIGKTFELPLNGWDARVAQHEFDHINGVFFLSRVSRQVQRQALREWEKEKKKLGIKKVETVKT